MLLDTDVALSVVDVALIGVNVALPGVDVVLPGVDVGLPDVDVALPGVDVVLVDVQLGRFSGSRLKLLCSCKSLQITSGFLLRCTKMELQRLGKPVNMRSS